MKMKRSVVIGLSTAALVMGGAIAKDLPAYAWPNLGQLFASKPAAEQQTLQLQLSAAKRMQSNGKTTWQEAGTKITATPGDVLRYTLKGANNGKRPLSNLVLTQPVPAGMVYQLNSASNPGGQLVYSIDGGKSYVAKPMVSVALPNGKTEMRPAPAEAYTHLRWQLSQTLSAGNRVDLSYEVRVR